ncbi:similar to RAB32 (predicted), isoform CRA_b [Rattus norvegicus]|uniref:Similar to RAB32 (Predicted), isoform CRA_b n=1 Tax=Rattus norvegicus TaxID=10116 RepID=A6JP37_RAT|nr:similar to RAB32 (predicted), isoform CRA_b [Rattus norvegicus]
MCTSSSPRTTAPPLAWTSPSKSSTGTAGRSCACSCGTSLDNINIDEATRFLVENMLANQQSFPREEIDMDKIKLVEEPPTTKPKSQCC